MVGLTDLFVTLFTASPLNILVVLKHYFLEYGYIIQRIIEYILNLLVYG